jgi:hypothetical protein
MYWFFLHPSCKLNWNLSLTLFGDPRTCSLKKVHVGLSAYIARCVGRKTCRQILCLHHQTQNYCRQARRYACNCKVRLWTCDQWPPNCSLIFLWEGEKREGKIRSIVCHDSGVGWTSVRSCQLAWLRNGQICLWPEAQILVYLHAVCLVQEM